MSCIFLLFFFSSRRRHTRWNCDWIQTCALPIFWLEITNLMIPGENDDPDETKQLCRWVLENLGDSVPIHFTAFHPDFKMTDKPRTPAATLRRARQIALSAGVKYCYVGNVLDDEGQTTFCPSCGRALIRRSWHDILDYQLIESHCPCGQKIPGYFPAREKTAPRSRARSILRMQ